MNLLRDVSLDALLAFAEFAEDGNFSRAALRLHLSQPALHSKISKLGAAIGQPLYVRHGRNLEITEIGRKVQRLARELAGTARAFQDELQESSAPNPVTLAAGEGAYLYLLGPGIRAHLAHRRHPLQLLTTDAAATLLAVRNGQAQLGVAALDSLPTDLATEALTRVGQVLAMPKKHPLATRRRIRLKDLAHSALIVPPVGRPHRMMLSQLLQSEQVPWQVAVEANGWELMLHLVRLGMGIAVVNACCRIPAGLTSRPIPELPSIQYHLIHRKNGVNGATSALKQTLLSHADGWRKRTL